jgi:hypothetical protein
MKACALFILFLALVAPSFAHAACRRGAFAGRDGDFVAVSDVSGAWRYLFRDGRRGAVGAPDSPVSCTDDGVSVRLAGQALEVWRPLPLRETNTVFTSAATRLAGQLVEPLSGADATRPLTVLVHGSEHTAAIGSIYGYALAAQGVSVFVYDKRGSGASEGDYTQNFELLADDAAAALVEARRLAAGRFGRSGFFGGSQGGWVAPLAATRSPAQFVAVGFGLVATPIEEDRDQMLDEAREAGLDAAAVRQIHELSDLTARLVRSHFTEGFEDLERFRRQVGAAPWAATVKGEYSGDMLRMSDADLRRIGRARFDNLELIWDYDAVATLRRLKVPLLWVLAGEDREAPIGQTRATLLGLARSGQPIDVFLFPDTDHGMVEFRTNPDGSRTATRITDGYLRLLADWMKGQVHGPYGGGERLQ